MSDLIVHNLQVPGNLSEAIKSRSGYSQDKSPLFSRLPQEVRDQIYKFTLSLDHHIHLGPCRAQVDNGCRSQLFYLAGWSAGCGSQDLPIPRGRLSFLLSCCRVYDEAHALLYKVNTFVFAPSFNRTLFRQCSEFCEELSLHRGLLVPPMTLGTVTLVLGDEHAPTTGHDNINEVAWALYHLSRGKFRVHISRLNLLFLEYSYMYAEEATSLRQVLEDLNAVKLCEVVGLGLKPKSPQNGQLTDVGKSLVDAAMAKSSKNKDDAARSSSLNPMAQSFQPSPRWNFTPMELDYWCARSEMISLGLI